MRRTLFIIQAMNIQSIVNPFGGLGARLSLIVTLLLTGTAQADVLAAQLESEYRQVLHDPARTEWALDGMADMQSARWQRRLAEKEDQVLVVPDIAASGETATWRNWKRMERELDGVARRQLFAEMVSKSSELSPLIEECYATLGQSYAEYGTTPLHVFARREGTSPEAIRALALEMGRVSREPFQAALNS